MCVCVCVVGGGGGGGGGEGGAPPGNFENSLAFLEPENLFPKQGWSSFKF